MNIGVEHGVWNENFGAEKAGFESVGTVHWNYGVSELYEESIKNREGEIAAGGALAVDTGQHTGRSAQDKYIVKDVETADRIWWDNNKEMEAKHFSLLWQDMLAHAKGMSLYAQDLFGGNDKAHRLPVRVFTEYAWHSLFIRNMLVRPEREEIESFVPAMTIIDLPSFRADPERHGCRSETVIACDFTRKVVLIAGTSYGGEMKKSVFSLLNYLLPEKGIMPMHCSANVGEDDDSALFFGLSGTGKTTLSADPNRTLIGDDEHGWSPEGIFNFEGGCYAKTINLSRDAEPEIYSTTERFGTVLENVVIDSETRLPDFDDGSKTENGRCCYPIDFISNASLTGRAPQPKNLIMLTADAFGVMPPIARLTPAQAMYHFLSGYTAKVAGTEKGLTEPTATFSTCFGAPFMPLHPTVYGELLRDLIAKHDVKCWLVNTGWTGGAHGVGSRMPIKETRALLSAALDGSLNGVEFRTDPNFGFEVPVEVAGVDNKILTPRETWEDKAGYDAQAEKLVAMFIENFAKFEGHVDNAVKGAAPTSAIAAE
ncbi:MAG: phosphoenolpyruvate carboxykinase [Pseudomonadota bacterium]